MAIDYKAAIKADANGVAANIDGITKSIKDGIKNGVHLEEIASVKAAYKRLGKLFNNTAQVSTDGVSSDSGDVKPKIDHRALIADILAVIGDAGDEGIWSGEIKTQVAERGDYSDAALKSISNKLTVLKKDTVNNDGVVTKKASIKIIEKGASLKDGNKFTLA